jgi:hypothetical protein
MEIIILALVFLMYEHAKELGYMNEDAENREQSRHTIKKQNNGKQK